jgi:hypothetical protein
MNRASSIVGTVGAIACLCVAGACTSGGADREAVGSSAEPILYKELGYYEYSFGPASTFAKHDAFCALGLDWGLPDGSLGAIAGREGHYRFFGSAKGAATGSSTPFDFCPSTSPACSTLGQGSFVMEGTLDALTGLYPSTCSSLFGPGAAAAAGATGWTFDHDYAGGGQVVPFSASTVGAGEGYLMPYHGEFQGTGGTCDGVHCYYGGIGLAVSTDDGASFKSVGQIIQLYEPRSVTNIGGGYGSLVVADANGNPNPTDLSTAYFYLLYPDTDENAGTGSGKDGNPAMCTHFCLALARAPYSAVVNAVTATPTNPAAVAALFQKYDANVSPPWHTLESPINGANTSPGGFFTPVFSDEGGAMASVIYDSTINAYLLAYMAPPADGVSPQTIDDEQVHIRVSSNLIDWSATVATFQSPPDSHGTYTDIYPTLIGEAGNPLVGTTNPRVYFQKFLSDPNSSSTTFPSWGESPQPELDWVAMNIQFVPITIHGCVGSVCY